MGNVRWIDLAHKTVFETIMEFVFVYLDFMTMMEFAQDVIQTQDNSGMALLVFISVESMRSILLPRNSVSVRRVLVELRVLVRFVPHLPSFLDSSVSSAHLMQFMIPIPILVFVRMVLN